MWKHFGLSTRQLASPPVVVFYLQFYPCDRALRRRQNRRHEHAKPFTHQHLNEVYKTIEKKYNINFLPIRGNFSRGIFCTSYIKTELDIDSIYKIYFDYYNHHPFTLVSNEEIHLKQVVNTNKCLIHLKKIEGKLLITSIIDNLIKGASGQAIQNMNLMFGLDETIGLKLKSSIF